MSLKPARVYRGIVRSAASAASTKEQTVFYYVESRYGTAGMGSSFGYASVIESDEELETYSEQTGSLSGPYTREEAEAIATKDNVIHNEYSDSH